MTLKFLVLVECWLRFGSAMWQKT